MEDIELCLKFLVCIIFFAVVGKGLLWAAKGMLTGISWAQIQRKRFNAWQESRPVPREKMPVETLKRNEGLARLALTKEDREELEELAEDRFHRELRQLIGGRDE